MCFSIHGMKALTFTWQILSVNVLQWRILGGIKLTILNFWNTFRELSTWYFGVQNAQDHCGLNYKGGQALFRESFTTSSLIKPWKFRTLLVSSIWKKCLSFCLSSPLVVSNLRQNVGRAWHQSTTEYKHTVSEQTPGNFKEREKKKRKKGKNLKKQRAACQNQFY